RANLGREAQIGEPDFAALRTAHRVVPLGPSGQTLPPPLKPGPPPSRCRRYRRREYRSCAPEIVAAAPPPLPGDPCLLGWPKPPGFHSPCSSAKSNLRAKNRQARPFAGHEGILDFRFAIGDLGNGARLCRRPAAARGKFESVGNVRRAAAGRGRPSRAPLR